MAKEGRAGAEQRPIWRGLLRVALVSCPVALYSAHRERGELHFHLINPATGHRIRMVTQDAETDEPVARRDLVKGYEFKKDQYLLLTDEDFASARVESSSVLNVTKFVGAAAIDPLHYDASYYVAPDGDAGEDVFVVLREAIAKTGRVALARVVLAGRERPVAIMPLDEGLVAHTLNEARDLNDPGPLFAGLEGIKPDPEMVKLAVQLIGRQSGRYDPADVEDRYEARLRELIEAKLRGEGIAAPEEEPERGKVIDLMAALRASLKGSDTAKPRAAPARSKKAAVRPAKKPVRRRA